MKKGQVQQVFIYAMTAIIVGLVLLLGYQFINKTLNQGCDVQLVKFKETLEREMDKSTSYGSFNRVELTRPCDYTTLHFIDGTATTVSTGNNIIDSAIQAGTGTTVFLAKPGATEPLFENNKVRVDTGHIPIEVATGKFSFGIRGQGQTIKIEALE